MTRRPKLEFPMRVPFVESLGLELVAMGDGGAELRVTLTDRHHNTWDVAHGGVVMTMLDVAMAIAARSGHPGGTAVATVEMKTSFMRPAEGQLRALGKLQHRTATLAFCEGSLFDDRGALCATATGTFKYLRGLPARGRVTDPSLTPTPNSPTDTPEDPT
ncbi:PaaI family thioesterase [Ideonella sp. A 288]|uniref:PaaI family thioesterase n=1 Tax=Ideonella sp. A 288 TaxID=1962181 RepID=UPI000B4BE782|nr:PaaI family thioesterase [Ideonella sp. A 288]